MCEPRASDEGTDCAGQAADAPAPATWYNAAVRLLVAVCSVEYEGRLAARLPPALRLVMLKRDGSLAVHSDSRAYKPLNWMSPPCTHPGGATTRSWR